MLIGIDGSEANKTNRDGSSEYAYQLLHSLYRVCLQKKLIHHFIVFLKTVDRDNLPKENQHWSYEEIPASKLWIIKKLIPRLVNDRKMDLFFTPTHYLPIITLIPQICTIHDLGYLMFSEQFKKYDFWQLKCWTAISIFVSKYIISVSESTKKDIVRHYPFARNKIDVVYHGINHEEFSPYISDNLVRLVKNKYKIRKNYILSFGTLKPSKNIDGIIEAFSKFIRADKQNEERYQLVIAGKKGWLYKSIFEKVKKYKIEDDVVFTGYVDEKDRPALYKGAKVLLSPSFWEGFGMHVLEAMSCGTPVVVSDRGSLPEVAGNCGVYVDPNNTQDILEGIKKVVLTSDIKYNKLVSDCIIRSKQFSWDKTAEGTISIFEKFQKI